MPGVGAGYRVPDGECRTLAGSIWNLVSGVWYLESGIRNPVPGTRYSGICLWPGTRARRIQIEFTTPMQSAIDM